MSGSGGGVHDARDWFTAPEAIRQAWRKWANQPGDRSSSAAFVAGWHAAVGHGLVRLLEEVRALRKERAGE